MKIWQKMNLFFFAVAIVLMASLVYVLGTMNFSNPFDKPWHLQPSVHEDSLTQTYRERYQILNHRSLFKQLYDSTRINLFILVDAWGVPTDESLLNDEFSLFTEVPHTYAIHQRMANRTKHAEKVELRNNHQNKIYLFGGDSLEYNRLGYIRELGYSNSLFCQNCADSAMLFMIDSLLANESFQLIAWTTQSSRLGNRDSLQNSLRLIADFAKRHPKVRLIVQGTHRPILGSAETRNAYKSHWVPAVLLNE